MSQPHDTEPLELHMFSPIHSDSIIELLTVVCDFHRTGARLGLGHSVNFGKPWLEGSNCNFGLISLPYLDGPDLERFQVPQTATEVRFLWLIPITEQERDFKKSQGLEALEVQFERAKFNYLDLERASVV
jgi:hypothetical protein